MFKPYLTPAASLAALLAISACAPATSSSPSQYASGVAYAPGSRSNPYPTVTATPSSSPTPTPTTGTPPIAFQIRGTGYTGTTIQVYTRTKLKIRFRPGVQDRNVAGSGFSPIYSKLGIYLTVGTQTEATEMLSNGSSGSGLAENSRTIDLSGGFTRTCDANDTSCRQPVQIQISKPNYDYWCLNYGMYCPWAQVYDTHPWNGMIYVQTDDTDAVETAVY